MNEPALEERPIGQKVSLDSIDRLKSDARAWKYFDYSFKWFDECIKYKTIA
jgi:hypothetical protein